MGLRIFGMASQATGVCFSGTAKAESGATVKTGNATLVGGTGMLSGLS